MKTDWNLQATLHHGKGASSARYARCDFGVFAMLEEKGSNDSKSYPDSKKTCGQAAHAIFRPPVSSSRFGKQFQDDPIQKEALSGLA